MWAGKVVTKSNMQIVKFRALRVYEILTTEVLFVRLFWKKPTGDCDSFKLLLFFDWQWLYTRINCEMDPDLLTLGYTCQRRKENKANQFHCTEPQLPISGFILIFTMVNDYT